MHCKHIVEITATLTKVFMTSPNIPSPRNLDVFGRRDRIAARMIVSHNREMISLMRDLSQIQQTTIKLVLTLAMYHAQSVNVMDEILYELDRAKGTHTRTASHIELLYEQVQLIRDMNRKRKPPIRNIRRWVLATALIGFITLFIYLWVRHLA